MRGAVVERDVKAIIKRQVCGFFFIFLFNDAIAEVVQVMSMRLMVMMNVVLVFLSVIINSSGSGVWRVPINGRDSGRRLALGQAEDFHGTVHCVLNVSLLDCRDNAAQQLNLKNGQAQTSTKVTHTTLETLHNINSNTLSMTQL